MTRRQRRAFIQDARYRSRKPRKPFDSGPAHCHAREDGCTSDGCVCRCYPCIVLARVKCARCGAEVPEGESWGEGDMGDETIPSFCSEACYRSGPIEVTP